jgi:NADPH:quinone reductase-like Zn-dependent oxidoreductase
MKAVVFDAPGAPEVLRVAEDPDPVPGPGEVLIEVAAAGVNRADCLQRMGKYPSPPGASEILGLEFSGTVLAAPDTARVRPGDRVMALVTGGAYASRATAPPEVLLPVPANLGWEEAAAIPEAFLAALARGGRLTLIGFVGGSRGDLDLRPILAKNLSVTGTTLRGSPLDLKARIVNDFNAFAAGRLADGRLRAVLDRTFPLEEAAEAHRYMEANRTRGKLVLMV